VRPHIRTEQRGPTALAAASRHALAALRRCGVRSEPNEVGIVRITSLCHGHGSQFISPGLQDELRTLGIESSPSFVRQPEGNGYIERCIRALREQPLWPRRFGPVAELDDASRALWGRFNHHWIIGRIG
jgi:putative transposase